LNLIFKKILYSIPQKKVVDRKNLFSRYYNLCRYDNANIERSYFYINGLLSSLQVMGVLAFYFTSKYDLVVTKGGKKNILAGCLFVFANIELYNIYHSYFLKKSFEKKYRHVDDENLENIIKSLEAYRVKAH